MELKPGETPFTAADRDLLNRLIVYHLGKKQGMGQTPAITIGTATKRAMRDFTKICGRLVTVGLHFDDGPKGIEMTLFASESGEWFMRGVAKP